MSNNKRSPLKSSPLRYPGQSLDKKIDNVFYDKILFPVLYVFFMLTLAIYEWMRSFQNVKPHPYFAIFIFLVVATYFLFKNFKYLKIIKNLKLGRDGERIVGESLELLRERGYKVFHDIVADNFNIDHIIVGPGGVFTIETKTISKNGNSKITYDGRNVIIDGFKLSRDPLKQARNQMFWLESFIYERAKFKTKVCPVIVFPGWYISQITSNTEVMVLNEKALPSFLKDDLLTLGADEINLISTHIESYIRNSN